MLGVVNISEVIFMKFCPFQYCAVDLVPFLDPFHHLRMLFSEFFANFMELVEKASPRLYYFFVIHPSKLHKRERVSKCPHKDCNDEFTDYDKCLLGGLSEGRDGRTNVGQPRVRQILHEKQFVSDALQVFPFRVGSHSH